MVGEFIQIFALLLSIGVLLLLFYLLTVRKDKLTPPLTVFLVLLVFISMALSYLSARVYIPLQVNATSVQYYQDPYGIGFLSLIMSLISMFLAIGVLLFAAVNQGMRTFRF
ncbi:MAG: hypothetical protein ACO2PN_16325 [Pyrobaculum sp.]|jgi:hypothetical protein